MSGHGHTGLERQNSSKRPGTMVHVMHMLFYGFLAVFKTLNSSFTEDNMLVHALDVFIENTTKMVRIIPLNTKNENQTLR